MSETYHQSLQKPREKSALYPAVTLEDCLEFIRKIDSIGGESVSYASIISLMGLKNPTTRSFLSRISASKQYGLILTGNSKAQLTDVGRRILRSADEEQTKNLLVDAFINPPLYQKLVERFFGKALPPKNQLANLLMNEYRIIRQVKDLAADCFYKSAQFLGLITDGVLYAEAYEKLYACEQSAYQEQKNTVSSIEETLPYRKAQESDHGTGYYFEIPTLSKNTAKIFIPADVTQKDLDYIGQYLQNMLPAFLENLKGEILKKSS